MFRSLIWVLCSVYENSSNCWLMILALLCMYIKFNIRVKKFQLAGRIILTLIGFLFACFSPPQGGGGVNPSVFETTGYHKKSLHWS